MASPIAERDRKKPLGMTTTLNVSAYDRAASMIITLLVLLGSVVFCLFFAWITSGIFHQEKSVPVVIEEFGGGIETGEGTEGQEIQAPDVGEVAAESTVVGKPLPDTLSAVVDAAATRAEDVEIFDRTEDSTVQQGGGSSRGTGDRPAKGTGGGAGGGHGRGLARQQRWEIHFPEGNTVETYARQLDFFEIELGLMDASSEIVYLSELSKEVPKVRRAPRTAENRVPMILRRGDLVEAEKELFARAKVEVSTQDIIKFLPHKMQALLDDTAQKYKNRQLKDIRRTKFDIKPDGKGFALVVTEQEYY